MANSIPQNRGLLAGLGEKVKAGLVRLAGALGITQMPADLFTVVLDAFNDALAAYNSGRSAQQVASNTYKAALADLTVFLKAARATLLPSFGDRWSTMWAQAGFVQPSTAIPKRLEDRIALALSLVNFLTANPTYEVASKGVTAALGSTKRTAVINAQMALLPAKVATQTANDALTTAQKALTAAIRTVIKVLSTTISKNDPRWMAFGLNMPAMDTTPPVPTGLSATMTDEGVLLGCDTNPLTTRYRYRGKFVGVDTDYRLLAARRRRWRC